jgi:hypothetical protein
MKTNVVCLWLNFNENKHILNNFTGFDSQHHVQDKDITSFIIWKHYAKNITLQFVVKIVLIIFLTTANFSRKNNLCEHFCESKSHFT